MMVQTLTAVPVCQRRQTCCVLRWALGRMPSGAGTGAPLVGYVNALECYPRQRCHKRHSKAECIARGGSKGAEVHRTAHTGGKDPPERVNCMGFLIEPMISTKANCSRGSGGVAQLLHDSSRLKPWL